MGRATGAGTAPVALLPYRVHSSPRPTSVDPRQPPRALQPALQRRGGRWLFPAEALSPVFRGIFLQRLKRLLQTGQLDYRGATAVFAEPPGRQNLLDELYGLDWVVYIKRPFGGPRQVLRYLARYTHRVAISNARIREITATTVSFAYRDRKEPTEEKILTLPGVEFLRRFAQHILPHGFTRVRFYGFWSNSTKTEHLARIRSLLAPRECNAQEPPHDPTAHAVAESSMEGMRLCPHCSELALRPGCIFPPSTGPPS